MDISTPLFLVFAGLAIACSLLVVLKKNPVASAFALVMVFFSFAAIYAMLDAHLIATLQVLVYTGAIMVLFIFVIMLLNADVPSFDFAAGGLGFRIAAGVLALILFGLFVVVFKASPSLTGPGPFTPDEIAKAGGHTRVVSELMFSDYVLPFELTSVLLLSAIIGAVAIAKRKQGVGRKGGLT